MSNCQQCGEKNPSAARFCENCGSTLPREEREKLQPGYGYDIHKADCRHGLKTVPMSPGEKLSILGNKAYLFLGNLILIMVASLLLMTNIFRTDHPLWQDFLGKETGLFGPRGQFFTAVYFPVLLLSLLIAGKPLYTRHTYNPLQLLPAILSDALLLLVLGLTVWRNLYFGDFLRTTLSTGGYLMLMVCLTGLILQFFLIREYKRLKKKGVYIYVAN